MSKTCDYLPIPPRVWSRVQNPCTFTVPGSTYSQVYIPLTNQTVSQEQADYEDKLIYKGNILQYKGNSSRLTKSQKYTQLAKGFGPNRTKVFATQSQSYTNPNTTGLQRVNYSTIPFPNAVVGEPNNISGPYQYDVANPNGCSGTSLQDGGTLVCGTLVNPCTGEIIRQGATSAIICNPASASDVPGSAILCWNNKVQTWFPKSRYTMNNSTNKWPVNYKGFVSAVKLQPPTGGETGGENGGENQMSKFCNDLKKLYNNDSIITINQTLVNSIKNILNLKDITNLVDLQTFNDLKINLENYKVTLAPNSCLLSVVDTFENIWTSLYLLYNIKNQLLNEITIAEKYKNSDTILKNKTLLQEYLDNINKSIYIADLNIKSNRATLKPKYSIYHTLYGIPENLLYDSTMLNSIVKTIDIYDSSLGTPTNSEYNIDDINSILNKL